MLLLEAVNSKMGGKKTENKYCVVYEWLLSLFGGQHMAQLVYKAV
jgi:hypothetical protein